MEVHLKLHFQSLTTAMTLWADLLILIPLNTHLYPCEPNPSIYSDVRSSLANCTSVEPSVHFPNQTFPRSPRKYKQKPHGANKT